MVGAREVGLPFASKCCYGTRSVPTTLNLIGIGSHAIAVSRPGGAGCAGFSFIPVCNGGRCYYRRRPFGLANLSRNLLPAIHCPQSGARSLIADDSGGNDDPPDLFCRYGACADRCRVLTA